MSHRAGKFNEPKKDPARKRRGREPHDIASDATSYLVYESVERRELIEFATCKKPSVAVAVIFERGGEREREKKKPTSTETEMKSQENGYHP